MPRRTNLLQKLVLGLKRTAASPDAAVHESREILDRDAGSPREVDIVLEQVLAGVVVRICFECVDRSRPQNVEWVEQMDSKHRALKTNKLVLVSRKGFTRPALRKAAALGHDALHLKTDDPTTLDGVLARYQELHLRVVTTAIEVVRIRIRRPEGEVWARLPADTAVYTRGATEPSSDSVTTLGAVAQGFGNHPNVVRDLMEAARPEHRWAVAGVETREPFCSLYDRDTNSMHGVVALEIQGRVELESAAFRPQAARLGAERFSYGSADLGSGLYVVVEANGRFVVDRVDPTRASGRSQARRRRGRRSSATTTQA